MAGPVTVIRLTDGARYDSMVAAARDHWITDGAIANAIRRGGTAAGHRWARLGPQPTPPRTRQDQLDPSLAAQVAQWVRWEAQGLVSAEEAWEAVSHLWRSHPSTRNLFGA